MKTHHIILLTTALFVVLFYDENVGLNLGLLGLVYAFFTLYRTLKKNHTRSFLALFIMSLLSSAAFAWYGDFPSFLALGTSLLLLAFKGKTRELKTLFIIPVAIVNGFTFLCRFFSFDRWLPKRNTSGVGQKLIAFVAIPAIFITLFFCIYTYGSDHFAHFFTDFEWDINFWQLFVLTAVGFFLAFNFWNFSIERLIYKQNHYLNNNFGNSDKQPKPTFSFMTLDLERASGIVTFLSLSVLLVFFIVTYNYEQFYETPKTPSQLSEETHERVAAVIFSIIMAIVVIMFYFKSGFNFDSKSRFLKISALLWVVLNAVLVFSAMAKNTEYVLQLGLTYKRLGVYAFLLLSVIGLVITFVKIQRKKTNAYLFNHMFWYFYATILACSFINWGGIATEYNIKNGKGDFSFLQTLNYNDTILKTHFPNEKWSKENEYEHRDTNGETFLSKVLYYECIKE